MPQLVPFYFINVITFTFLIIAVAVYLLSKYILPRFVRLFLSRTFISRSEGGQAKQVKLHSDLQISKPSINVIVVLLLSIIAFFIMVILVKYELLNWLFLGVFLAHFLLAKSLYIKILKNEDNNEISLKVMILNIWNAFFVPKVFLTNKLSI